jgi:hypothetical protein
MPVLALAGVLASMDCFAQPQCTAVFGDSRVDLGELRRPHAALAREPLRMPVRSETLTVTCPRDAVMTLVFSAREAAQEFAFGNGGHLQVRISEALLDGRKVQLRLLNRAGASGTPSFALDTVKPGDIVQPAVSGTSASGSMLQLQFELAAVVQPVQWRANDLHELEAALRVRVSMR